MVVPNPLFEAGHKGFENGYHRISTADLPSVADNKNHENIAQGGSRNDGTQYSKTLIK